MRYKFASIISILSIMVLIFFEGCITETLPKNMSTDKEYITIKYLNKGSIITAEDFPDFEFMAREYIITRENLTMSLQVEGSHGASVINDSINIPAGYRIYGISEAYNSSKNISGKKYDRYLLLQYKVFDNNESLNDSMDLTLYDYIENGFRSKTVNTYNGNYKGRIFLLESNVANRTDVNVTIVLFGHDTIIGKIGVQDSGDRSLEEALKILDIVFERLEINTKRLAPAMDFSSSDPEGEIKRESYNRSHYDRSYQ